MVVCVLRALVEAMVLRRLVEFELLAGVKPVAAGWGLDRATPGTRTNSDITAKVGHVSENG